jgi:hypothetical protein
MTYLTDRQVAQNLVSKGDVALRQHDPLWAVKITRPIDVADGALNPLGQVFGSYKEGLRTLGLTEPDATECGLSDLPDTLSSHVNAVWNDRVVINAQRLV